MTDIKYISLSNNASNSSKLKRFKTLTYRCRQIQFKFMYCVRAQVHARLMLHVMPCTCNGEC